MHEAPLMAVPEERPSTPKAEQCADMVNRCRELLDAAPEATELEYRESPADTPETQVMARLELVRDALTSEAEAAAEQGNMHAERAARMLEQLKEAEMQIYGIYCDAQQDSEELAGLIEEMFPWVQQYTEEQGTLSQAA